jgi:5-methylcytosine-specific restriction protein A
MKPVMGYEIQGQGHDPTKKEPKFIRVGHGLYWHAQKEFLAIEEVEKTEGLLEGTTKTISVNAYERNPEARKKCIEHYGYSCRACGFNFEKMYGELGKSFTHVHHIKPLSEIKEAYIVDPIKDLIPLCANCHAMVHRVNPPLSIDLLKTELHDRIKPAPLT